MPRSLAIVLLLAAPAVAGHGGSTAVRIDATSPGTRVDQLSVSTRGDRTTAAFTVSTARTSQDTWVTFDVPVATQVSYLGITIGAEHRIAHANSAEDAATVYRNTVEGVEDPALVEWVDSSRSRARLRLRVFPLSRGKPARVELIMAPDSGREIEHVDATTSLFIGAPLGAIPHERPIAPWRRASFHIASECLDNPLAPSCM